MTPEQIKALARKITTQSVNTFNADLTVQIGKTNYHAAHYEMVLEEITSAVRAAQPKRRNEIETV